MALLRQWELLSEMKLQMGVSKRTREYGKKKNGR